MTKKRVLVVYTGGTIGMRATEAGYAPEPGDLGRRIEAMPELTEPDMPSVVIDECEPLLDSADMKPADWLRIADKIASNYDAFDGFVVLHGTDTMAYTASALPFMLRGLAKPVILTGAQIPIGRVRSDARDNVITSLAIAARGDVPEVCVYFAEKLMRGCRTVKVNADGLDAFASPNFPFLGKAGIDIRIRDELVRRPSQTNSGTMEPLKVQPLDGPIVAAIRLFPGISARMLDQLLQPPLQGLVLETYGVGNGPAGDEELMDVLRRATSEPDPIVVVATSQCVRGTVDHSGYATGAALHNAGVRSGADMTSEAALAKLYFLIRAGLSQKGIATQIERNLVGELTERD
ncbi:MAG: L-asparaginase [Planctomycetota bacterium]|jgi:L-asparaginase